ncbi:extracellular serine/threonine protein kinase FAM20C-like [Tubulanus polymorphus]|uniref:extracellular serine/threonine protein kinase FAM20C-like n=1 Tax=Tubulanus polymorphus TaxID=672921 RepID=UPI003DA4E84A
MKLMMKFHHRFVFLIGFMCVLSVILTTTTVLQYVLEQRRTVKDFMNANAQFMRSSVSDTHVLRRVKDDESENNQGKETNGAAVIPRNNTLVYVEAAKSVKTTLLDDSTELFIRRKLADQRKEIREKGAQLDLYESSDGTKLPSWGTFHNKISRYELYSEESDYIDRLLYDMSHKTITDAEMKAGGTQLKVMITFSDEGQALMKPMRFTREKETLPDHFYFVDYERHNAEVAAFHLDRILGFRRVPPCAGRIFNISRDLEQYAEYTFKKTFFRSPAKNHCFHGVCSYYCDTSHAFCGNPDTIEGSLCAYLPSKDVAQRKNWRNPWKRSYSKHKQAAWETDSSYCKQVQQTPPYNKGRRLLDLIDLAVFDYLTGNMDRHHYETFLDFGNDTFLLHLDQGRAFGKSLHDETSILAPLYQCCYIRASTWQKLKFLRNSPVKLSDLMQKSLTRDVINPVLLEPHLLALDRRIIKILRMVKGCIRAHGEKTVVIDDGF